RNDENVACCEGQSRFSRGSHDALGQILALSDLRQPGNGRQAQLLIGALAVTAQGSPRPGTSSVGLLHGCGSKCYAICGYLSLGTSKRSVCGSSTTLSRENQPSLFCPAL